MKSKNCLYFYFVIITSYKYYSLAIEPIYPQVCQRITIMHQPNPIDAPISPVGLSELLNSLPCCLSLNRQDPLPVYHLIMEVNNLKIVFDLLFFFQSYKLIQYFNTILFHREDI